MLINSAILMRVGKRYPVIGELLKNGSLLVFSGTYQVFLSALLSIALSRRLGVDAFGVYIATQSFVSLIYSFAQLGVHVPARRETSQNNQKFFTYFGSAFATRLLITSPFSLIVALLVNERFKIATDYVTILVVLVVILSGFAGLLSYALQSLDKFVVNTKISVITTTIYFGLVVIGLVLAAQLWLVLALMFIGKLVTVAAYYLALNSMGYRLHPNFDLRLGFRIVRESLPIVLSDSTESISLRTDSVFVAILVGTSAAGIYGVSYSIYTFVAAIGYFGISAIFPTLARYSRFNSVKKYSQFVYKLQLGVGLCSILVGSALYLLIPFLINLVYGVEFVSSVLPAQILLIGLPFVSLNRLMVQVLNASHRQRFTLWATAIGALFNVGANIFVIQRYGIQGAAVTTVITECLVWLVALIGFRQAVKE